MILGFMTDVRGRFLDAWNYYDPLKGSRPPPNVEGSVYTTESRVDTSDFRSIVQIVEGDDNQVFTFSRHLITKFL